MALTTTSFQASLLTNKEPRFKAEHCRLDRTGCSPVNSEGAARGLDYVAEPMIKDGR